MIKYVAILITLIAIAAFVISTTCLKKTENISPQKKLLLYKAEWCPACKGFLPVWENVKKNLKGEIDVEVIECTEDPDRCANIAYLPTLKLVNGDKVEEFSISEPKTEASVLNFARR